jgi:voltage-dependent calcium channel L type alpha-1D
MEGTSLGLFSINSKIRQVCYKLCYNNNYFEITIAICILISSIQLAIENPLLDPKGTLAIVLWYVDILTTMAFTLECIFKIIAFGYLANGEDSYLRDGWNIMDFSIVIMSMVSLFDKNSSLKAFKIFRILKVLRPLRFIARN